MAPPPPLSFRQEFQAYGPIARLLGVAHYGNYTALTFAVVEDGAVHRLRIEGYEAAKLAAHALPPEYRAARPRQRRRGLLPALHAVLFGDAQENWGSEHQANETGNLGKGLPNDPDNVPENQNIGLRVAVETMDGTRLWERRPDGGMTAASYREDGTLAAIIAAIEEALRQARGELGADDLHAVANVGASATEIERDVPPAAVRRGNPGR